MKKFREYLNEEMMPFAQTEKGFVGVDNGPVRDNINIHLASITAKPYATPYHAMEMVRKVLAPFSIFPPHMNFLDGDSGHEVFEINQFGDKMGMTNDGTVVVKNSDPYFLYFEYAMNDKGGFDIFCEIVTEEELSEIMSDIESEMEDGDTTDGNMEDAEDSFDSYKSDNQIKEENIKESIAALTLGTLAGIPLSYGMIKSGIIPKVGDKISSTLKKLKKKKSIKEDNDPCWDSHEMVGMKMKGGRKVPNCVPKKVDEATLGGAKYKRKHNPNNAKSSKSPDYIKAVMDKAYGKVADLTGQARKRALQKGHAAFKVGMANKK